MTERDAKPNSTALAWAISGLLYVHTAGVQAGDAAQGKKPSPRLEQKRALVEKMLFESPLGRQASEGDSGLDSKVYDDWDAARRAYEQAVSAIGLAQDGEAESSLDMALNLYRAASTKNRKAGLVRQARGGMLGEVGERIRGYQASLERIVREKNPDALLELDAAWVSAEIAKAEELAGAGLPEQAASVLLSAQATLEQALVRARSGETLVTRLEFDSPEEALEYEIEKLANNEQLLEALASSTGLEQGKRHLLSSYLQQSKAASARAREKLDAGDLAAATNETEAATAAQTRALRLFGVGM